MPADGKWDLTRRLKD